ncbi:HTH domain protein [Clostridium luticellarii]|uniref:HTH domain protein n=2 Tax=Clostridium luticellarii TaxID=1691940 RepID=A0A2T0BQA1_9CLOT|nr:HTH domain protein [Clostridium luticellarii]
MKNNDISEYHYKFVLGVKSMSKISNLLEMIMIIQYKGLTTASELAQTLGVDKKTVYRYISSLNKANIPVYTKKGRYGGFYIDKNFYMKPVDLTKEELTALLMASEMLTTQNEFVYERELKSAVYKIKNVCVNSKMDLNDIDDTGNFSMDYIGNTENLENKISKVNYSMNKGRSLNINYFSINKSNLTMRKVDPYNLIFKQGDWYIIGYCHMKDDVESFKLNRIKSLEVSSDIYIRPHNFSLKDYLRDHWELFMEGNIKVVVKFNRNISSFIKEVQWTVNQNVAELENGNVLLSFYVDDVEDVKEWVMGFGRNAEVIEPEKLRKNIKLELEELYKKY